MSANRQYQGYWRFVLLLEDGLNRVNHSMDRVTGWRRALLVAMTLIVVPPWSAYAEMIDNADIRILVIKKGDLVAIDASYLVPVATDIAWDVLTDYEHMAEVLPQLRTSTVLARSENKLRVSQTGRIFFGPIPVAFDYLRDVELSPRSRIQSHVIGGSLKHGDVTTELMSQNSQTRIIYHSEAAPGIWLPFGISEMFIRDNVHDQLIHMRDEMIRRKKREVVSRGG